MTNLITVLNENVEYNQFWLRDFFHFSEYTRNTYIEVNNVFILSHK